MYSNSVQQEIKKVDLNLHFFIAKKNKDDRTRSIETVNYSEIEKIIRLLDAETFCHSR